MTDNISDMFPLTQIHHKFMQQAYFLAEQAYREKEIPVGAIVVYENRIIGKGYNQVERLKDPTAHAEILAITAACQTIESKFLQDCTLYVTLEPCPMCAGALVWSRLKALVYGAHDAKAGACGSLYNIVKDSRLNHQMEVIQGVMELESEELLKQFFSEQRK